MIHRDLKPANVMVGAFAEVQVVDWGFAKVLRRGGVADERRAKKAQPTISLIETIRSKPGSSGSDSVAGSILGTPAYMPPEQARGDIDELDERADVFALGAILCEILVGHPPYTGTSEEVLLKAADAKLKPAREALENCGAERGLIELALRCLHPAAATRPRNAQAVADAVNEYLHSVEERAHQAKLEAAEARVKEVAAHKAHRLTLALAGAVVVILVLGGGGYLFFEEQRRQQREATVAAAKDSLDESRELRARAKGGADLGLFDAALAAALRSRQILEAGDADLEDRDRVAQLVGQLEEERALLLESRERAARDQEMLERLEEIWGSFVDTLGTGISSHDYGDQQYAEAFRDYGLDIESMDLDEACARIADLPIGIELASSLGEWAVVRRQSSQNRRESVAHDWTSLIIIAQAADPDEFRGEIRDAVIEKDHDRILDLASSPDLGELPASTLYLLFRALLVRDRPGAIELLRYAQSLKGDSYQINLALAYWLINAEDKRQYYAVALGLRPHSKYARRRLAELTEDLDAKRLIVEEGIRRAPDEAYFHLLFGSVKGTQGDKEGELASIREAIRCNSSLVTAHFDLGYALIDRGDLAGALAAFREAVRLNPRSVAAHNFLGLALIQFGDLADAADEFRECLQLQPRNARAWSNLAGTLWFAGEQDRALAEYRQMQGCDESLFVAVVAKQRGDEAEAAQFSRKALLAAQADVERNSNGSLAFWNLSWILATSPDRSLRDARESLRAAERAVGLSNDSWNAVALAVACARNEDWHGVVRASRSMEPGDDEVPRGIAHLCAAMAYWELGEHAQARKEYEQGVRWLEEPQWTAYAYRMQGQEFRTEAEQVLGIER